VRARGLQAVIITNGHPNAYAAPCLQTLQARHVSPQDLVKEVRARGLQAVIITNGHPEVQRSKIAACGAEASFLGTHILIGGEEIAAGRAEKPAASIFHSACRLANCRPDEVIGRSCAQLQSFAMTVSLATTICGSTFCSTCKLANR